MILVTPKQEVERKIGWFCGVNFFRSNLKVEWENGVWTKIRFIGSGFLFTCGNFTLIFLVFSIFFGSDLFRNGFPNPFIVRSWSSFLFSQWKFFELCVRTCPVMFFYFFCYVSLYLILPLFQHFAWYLFDFSRLVSLFSHSAKSDFEHQLLSRAIQNEQSKYKNWSQK